MDVMEVHAGSNTAKANSKSSSSVGDCDGEEGIPEFFDGLSVLVTGATGFIGILLVEKLLCDCPGLKNIYVLVRPKKGKTPSERMKRLFEDPVFGRVQNETSKVIVMSGDCAEKDLGLSPEDRAVLVQNVNVVFHCAATVRFDEPLRLAAHINVRGTIAILHLAHQIKNLKAFVHVSTAYSNCPHPHVDERFYEPKMSPEELLNIVDSMDEKILAKVAADFMDPWPNSYTFTKAIAERVVLREGKGLPICVVRPSIVINAYREPLPGWINNINGPVGLMLVGYLGILHVALAKDLNYILDIIPGDIVVNGIIVSAWNNNRQRQNSELKRASEESTLPIYHFVSSARNAISWRNFIYILKRYALQCPTERCIWYYFAIVVYNEYLEKIIGIFVHLIPAVLVDAFLFCTRRKPMLWSAYKKIDKYFVVMNHFALNEWRFDDRNVEHLSSQMKDTDKEKFPIDISTMDWNDMLKDTVPGLREYVVKDPMSTLESARSRYKKLKILHYTCVCIFYLLILKLFWWMISYFM